MDEQNLKQITIFSKFCIPCVKGEAYTELENYLNRNGYDWKVVRTTYLPKLHEEATKKWGDEKYTVFLYQNGKSIDFDYAIERIRSGEQLFEEVKQVKPKAKPIKKGKVK